MAETSPGASDPGDRAPRIGRDGARLVARPSAALVSLRARGDACARAARRLQLPALPGPNEVAASVLGDCLWLRPDEWLVAAPLASLAANLEALNGAVASAHGAAIDISASRGILELSGHASRDVLAGCCAIDLHPRVFTPARCAQTLIAKAPVLLHLVDAAPTWRLYVRPSHMAYVLGWLHEGMPE